MEKEAYLIHWEDGTKRTVQATSPRNGAIAFVGTYKVPVGSTFFVRRRGDALGAWTGFRRTTVGLRTLGQVASLKDLYED